MAVSTVPIPPDPARDRRAEALVDSVGTWPRFTLRQPWGSFEAGTVFRRAYGSNGTRYLVNAVACECPDYQQSGFICKHIRAYVLWEQHQQPAPAPKRAGYRDVFNVCDVSSCDEDRERGERYCSRHVLVDAF